MMLFLFTKEVYWICKYFVCNVFSFFFGYYVVNIKRRFIYILGGVRFVRLIKGLDAGGVGIRLLVLWKRISLI